MSELLRSNSSTIWRSSLGGDFLECAIEGFWEAIAQLLQFFAKAIGDF
jgi:hypothetical protein